MSRAIASSTGKVRRARKIPPTPRVSPIVCRRPNRAGTSKSVRVAACPPTWTTLTTKSRARQGGAPVRVDADLWGGADLGGHPGAQRLGGREPLGVDVVQPQRAVAQLGHREDVDEQLAGEHRRFRRRRT